MLSADGQDPSPSQPRPKKKKSQVNQPLHAKFWDVFGRTLEDPGSRELAQEVWRDTEGVQTAIGDWKRHAVDLADRRDRVHAEIEERRAAIAEILDKYTDSLHGRVDATVAPRLDHAHDVIGGMRDAVKEVRKALNAADTDDDGLRLLLRDIHSSVKDVASRQEIHGPGQNVLKMKLSTSGPPRKDKIEELFGSLDGIQPACTGWVSTNLKDIDSTSQDDNASDESCNSGSETDSSSDNGRRGAESPRLVMSFSCKTKKDKRELGLTDVVALSTPESHIAVVDKHNKLVKVFDSDGRFVKFIGYKFLKDPSRLAVLQNGGGAILITDDHSKDIKIFNKDGNYLGEFGSDLAYPSAVCETPDGQIAVLDYSMKSVKLYDDGGRLTTSVPVDMTCPAYVTGLRNGCFAVSDRKNSTVKIFSSETGAASVSLALSGESRPRRPVGLSCGPHGELLVADGQGDSVLVYDPSTGEYRTTYDHLTLPTGLSCRGGRLLVAEYQGVVKVLDYGS